MSFSELLFTFQPFPRPRFRMIVCPIIPFALPRATRMLNRPIAHTFAQSVALMLATLVFPLSRFRLLNKYARPARRPRTYPARALARGTHVYSNVFARPLKTTRAFCRSIIKKPRTVVGIFVILISCGQTRQKPSGVTIISPVWTAALRAASTHSTADFVRFATLNSLKTSLLRSSFSI